MESYTLNNINFRITSSTALSQFKAGQAFDFNELIRLNKDYFSKESRETLLLNYDLWFRWLLRLEKMFLVKNSNTDLSHDKASIIVSIKCQLDEVVEVMRHHPNIFIPQIINQMRIAHRPTNALLIVGVEEALNENIFMAFPQIVNLVSKKLHRLLFELHEYEFAQKPGKEFLAFTESSFMAFDTIGVYPTVERAKLYISEFGVKEFTIKNYSSNEINSSVLEILKQNGIKIKDTIRVEDRRHVIRDPKAHDLLQKVTLSESAELTS